MSKGKHAALQNAKKLATAEDRIQELERDIKEIRHKAHLEQQALATEIQMLRNRLASDVQALASAEIQQARQEAQARVDEAVRSHQEAVIAAFAYMRDAGEVRLELSSWNHVAAIVGIHPGQLITSASGRVNNRLARRSNRASMNRLIQNKAQS